MIALALCLAGCGDADDAPRAPSGLDADPLAVLTEPALDARVEQARRDAAASGRRVLLDFGADWCADCREVVRLSRIEPGPRRSGPARRR